MHFPNFEINQYHEIKIILESLELPFISQKMLRSLEKSLENPRDRLKDEELK